MHVYDIYIRKRVTVWPRFGRQCLRLFMDKAMISRQSWAFKIRFENRCSIYRSLVDAGFMLVTPSCSKSRWIFGL